MILGGTILAVAWASWIATRIWVPLDTSVSLSPGSMRTGEFKINISGEYWVYIQAHRDSDSEEVSCWLGLPVDECKNIPPILKMSWSLSEAGRNIADGSSDIDPRTFGDSETAARGLGFFSAEEGRRYVLDVHVLADGSLLNAANPRLRIEELGGIYREYRSLTVLVLLLGMFSVVVGLTLWFPSLAHTQPVAPSTPSKPVAAKPEAIISVQMWIGIALVLIGLAAFIGIHRWMATRTFVAADMPISLARGHIRTGPFKINLKDSYGVRLDTGSRSWFDPKCLPYDVRARWTLYKDGQVVAIGHQSHPYTYYLGNFDSENGTYDLDLEVLSDTGCLNPGNPRLLIYTSKSSYEDDIAPALWVLAICVVLGASLLALGCIALFGERRPATTRITDSESIGQNFRWAQELPLKKRFSVLPAFALIAGSVLFVPFIAFFILSPIPAKGLYVHVLKPGPLAPKNGVPIEPVVVQVVDAGPGVEPDVYVNSHVTSWDKLGDALKDELKIRPERMVYVEGDENVPWSDAVNAVDIAKRLHADVVLLTSKPSTGLRSARKAAK